MKSLYRIINKFWKPNKGISTEIEQRIKALERCPWDVYSFEDTFEVPSDIRRKVIGQEINMSQYFFRSLNIVRFLRKYAGLTRNSRVVELGCGWGMLALGLSAALDYGGRYWGIDIQKEVIEWASKNMAWCGTQFSFIFIDTINTLYNPEGTIDLDNLRLPLEDSNADIVFLGSVFTHMQKQGVIAHLKEIRRIMKPFATVAFSYFDSSIWKNGESYITALEDNPDNTTFFSEGTIQEMLAITGLVEKFPKVNWIVNKTTCPDIVQTFVIATHKT